MKREFGSPDEAGAYDDLGSAIGDAAALVTAIEEAQLLDNLVVADAPGQRRLRSAIALTEMLTSAVRIAESRYQSLLNVPGGQAS